MTHYELVVERVMREVDILAGLDVGKVIPEHIQWRAQHLLTTIRQELAAYTAVPRNPEYYLFVMRYLVTRAVIRFKSLPQQGMLTSTANPYMYESVVRSVVRAYEPLCRGEAAGTENWILAEEGRIVAEIMLAAAQATSATLTSQENKT
jgi:hypothetical protein